LHKHQNTIAVVKLYSITPQSTHPVLLRQSTSAIVAMVEVLALVGCTTGHSTPIVSVKRQATPSPIVLTAEDLASLQLRFAAFGADGPARVPADSPTDPMEADQIGREELTAWTNIATDLGLVTHASPPSISRAYAFLYLAIHDAWAASDRLFPGALSQRAVAAGAAGQVLHGLYRREWDRISGEVATRVHREKDRKRALALGEEVGRIVFERGEGPRVVTTPQTEPPPGPAYWRGVNPVDPDARQWHTWIISSPAEFQPEPPYPPGSLDDKREVEELIAVSRRVTSRDVAIVHKWADLPPPVIWNQLAARLIDSHKVDRWTAINAYTYMNMAMHDAFVSCWHTKYHYWVARPFQRIPQLVTIVATPHFPTYTSGHATVSSAAGVVLGAFFPAENTQLRAEAAEAAQSRLLAGIHFRHDNDQGLAVGRRIGEKVVSAARQHGAL
jgi:hypothetical protein